MDEDWKELEEENLDEEDWRIIRSIETDAANRYSAEVKKTAPPSSRVEVSPQKEAYADIREPITDVPDDKYKTSE